MENIDQQLQARVWSRVNGRSEITPLAEPAGRFAELTGELAACYRHLGQKIPACRDLEGNLKQNQNQIYSLQALRGIREPRKSQPLPKGNAKAVLERCCHLERRADGLWAYPLRGKSGLIAALSGADPQWGEVFVILARQARQRCLAVLGLRGIFGK